MGILFFRCAAAFILTIHRKHIEHYRRMFIFGHAHATSESFISWMYFPCPKHTALNRPSKQGAVVLFSAFGPFHSCQDNVIAIPVPACKVFFDGVAPTANRHVSLVHGMRCAAARLQR